MLVIYFCFLLVLGSFFGGIIGEEIVLLQMRLYMDLMICGCVRDLFIHFNEFQWFFSVQEISEILLIIVMYLQWICFTYCFQRLCNIFIHIAFSFCLFFIFLNLNPFPFVYSLNPWLTVFVWHLLLNSIFKF